MAPGQRSGWRRKGPGWRASRGSLGSLAGVHPLTQTWLPLHLDCLQEEDDRTRYRGK